MHALFLLTAIIFTKAYRRRSIFAVAYLSKNGLFAMDQVSICRGVRGGTNCARNSNMAQHGKPTDPYRILFPLGIVLGAAGVSIWPLYHYGVTAGYSGRAHAFAQTNGFLYAFIAGFLLTVTEGMVLLLVLGIGGFLGPRLLGFAALPKFGVVRETTAPPINRILFYKVAGLAVLLSVISQYGFAFPGMAFVRAAAATAVILSTIQPRRFPAVRTTLAWCVWTAHWLVVLSLWLVAIAPRYQIDLLHVMFIGGFTLLILAVGTPRHALAWRA
jgi:hypothetical protein